MLDVSFDMRPMLTRCSDVRAPWTQGFSITHSARGSGQALPRVAGALSWCTHVTTAHQQGEKQIKHWDSDAMNACGQHDVARRAKISMRCLEGWAHGNPDMSERMPHKMLQLHGEAMWRAR